MICHSKIYFLEGLLVFKPKEVKANFLMDYIFGVQNMGQGDTNPWKGMIGFIYKLIQ